MEKVLLKLRCIRLSGSEEIANEMYNFLLPFANNHRVLEYLISFLRNASLTEVKKAVHYRFDDGTTFLEDFLRVTNPHGQSESQPEEL
ncbi:hypothetical protein [Capnocytophaga canis]|uniref:hypothetical protein n=1 Tax=Capnocytophaga canis TaxID=1848903 RepID=UPI001BB40D1A|nr:hypothetical protein [Capnocytophaga canis]